MVGLERKIHELKGGKRELERVCYLFKKDIVRLARNITVLEVYEKLPLSENFECASCKCNEVVLDVSDVPVFRCSDCSSNQVICTSLNKNINCHLK